MDNSREQFKYDMRLLDAMVFAIIFTFATLMFFAMVNESTTYNLINGALMNTETNTTVLNAFWIDALIISNILLVWPGLLIYSAWCTGCQENIRRNHP